MSSNAEITASPSARRLAHIPMLRRIIHLEYSRRSISLRLFLTCWLVFALHFATNTVREIYPALSLVEKGSFDVSEYLGLHPDIFDIPGRGAYINNNPGASILGAVPYAVFHPVVDFAVSRIQAARERSGAQPPEYDSIYPMAREFYREAYRRGFDVKFGLAAGIMAVFLMAPLSAFSAVVMFQVLMALQNSTRAALLLAFLYAFATPVFYRTAQLNQNLLQALFAFFAFVLIWRPWDKAGGPKGYQSFLAGLLAGFTLLLDYSGLVIILALSIYVLLRWLRLSSESRSITGLVYFALGVILCGVGLMIYQWQAFGSPIYPAQHYMPPTSLSVYGYNGIDIPRLDLLFENSFGIRFGLFAAAPILLLALWIPAWFNPRLRLLNSLETGWILSFSLVFFLFTAANQFSRLQFNSGVRHMLPVVPFLFLLAAGVLLRLPAWLAWTVGLFSTYWSWSLAMYRDVEQGLGILEAVKAISLHGPQLPWLVTLQRLGYAPDSLSTWWLFASLAVIIVLIWGVRYPSRKFYTFSV